jgi:hypothetical protein
VVLISSFVRGTIDMMRSKSRQALQGPCSASVVEDNTTVEVAARLPHMVAVVVAVIISIIVLLAGSG